MNMSTRRGAVLFVIILLVFVSLSYGAPDQDQRRQDKKETEGGLFSGGFSPAAIQARIINAYKDQLGVTDEEWTVIQPRLSKVIELSQKTRNMSAMMRWNTLIQPRLDTIMEQDQDTSPMAYMIRMFVDRVRREREKREQDGVEQQSPVEQSLMELQETLGKPAPSSAEIKAKMIAFRGAKEKIRQELAEAQKELTAVLTLKQEALLLMLGVLE